MRKFILILAFAAQAWAAASVYCPTPVVAASGYTITCTVSGTGYTAPLTPTTGITGVSVVLADYPMEPVSVTASGSVLTVHVAGIFSTDTVALTISDGSNLQDSAGNSMSGQTATPVTNNSTLVGSTINATSILNSFVGGWNAVPSGSGYLTSNGGSNIVDVSCTATDVQALHFGSDGFLFYLDGVLTGTNTVLGGWHWSPVYTGLSSTAHHVVLEWWSYMPAGSIFRAAGTCAVPSGYGTPYSLVADPLTTYASIEGSPVLVQSTDVFWKSSDDTYPSVGTANVGIRFKAATNNVWVTVRNIGTPGSSYTAGPIAALAKCPDSTCVNATVVGTATATTDNRWLNYQIGSSLGGTPAYYLFTFLSSAGYNASASISMDGTGLLPEKMPDLPIFIIFGDSIALEWVSLTDSRQGQNWPLRMALPVAPMNIGFGGFTMEQSISKYAVVTGLSKVPKYVMVALGVNDQIAGVLIGAVGVTDSFTDSTYRMLQTSCGVLTAGSKCIMRAVLPNTASNYTLRSTYTAAQAVAVAAYNATNPVVRAIFMATDNWCDGTSECVMHPTASGYAKIAAQERGVIAAAMSQERFGWIGQ